MVGACADCKHPVVPNGLEEGRLRSTAATTSRPTSERWEDEWREHHGTERKLVQGLIQIAAGLHHLQQQRAGQPRV